MYCFIIKGFVFVGRMFESCWAGQRSDDPVPST